MRSPQSSRLRIPTTSVLGTRFRDAWQEKSSFPLCNTVVGGCRLFPVPSQQFNFRVPGPCKLPWDHDQADL